MKSLWSRGQSLLSCRCISCLNASSGAAVIRTASASSRVRLLLGNRITALYGSIFASAAIIDAQRKDKRKFERQKEIETVKAEIKELQEEENRILQELARKRNRRSYTPRVTRRQYSTASNLHAVSDDYYNDVNMAWMEDQGVPGVPNIPGVPNVPSVPGEFGGPEELSTESHPGAVDHDNDGLEGELGYQGPLEDQGGSERLRMRAVQILAMKQLAIRLLLRPTLAHTYGVEPKEFTSELDLYRVDTEKLLLELDSIRKRIRSLKVDDAAMFHDLASDMTITQMNQHASQRRQLTIELRELFDHHFSGDGDLSDLFIRVADNILASEEPLPPSAVALLITKFTLASQHDVVKMIIKTLLPNGFFVNSSVIAASVHFFSKTRDLRGFDFFLKTLEGRGHPVNIRDYWIPFTHEVTEVPVPPQNLHPNLMGALITASLAFDHVNRANAWLEVMRRSGYIDTIPVLNGYLRFYGGSRNWDMGRFVLLRGVAYIMLTKAHNVTSVRHLILRMIAFCERCYKYDLSHDIVTAAVRSGINYVSCERWSEDRLPTRQAGDLWREACERELLDPNYEPSNEDIYAFGQGMERIIRDVILAESEKSEDPHVEHQRAVNNLETIEEHRATREEIELERTLNFLWDEVKASESNIRDLAFDVNNAKHEAEIKALKEQMSFLQTMVVQNFQLSTKKEEKQTNRRQKVKEVKEVEENTIPDFHRLQISNAVG